MERVRTSDHTAAAYDHICDDRSRFLLLLLLTWVPLSLSRVIRAHFLLSCRIISDRVLLPSAHSYTERRKKRHREERDQMLVTDRFPSPSSPPFFFPVCFFSFSWLPHFLPSASFFSLPLLPRFPATLGVLISKRKHRAEPQLRRFPFPNFPFFFYGQCCPSRPVVQEMPSNLIGLGEECARPTQNNSEKKLIRKNKNCAS